MGLLGWIGERIRRWEERPADPSVLDAGRNAGSEAMLDADSAAGAKATARGVHNRRDRRRNRWRGQ